jgi:hypothetical protein
MSDDGWNNLKEIGDVAVAKDLGWEIELLDLGNGWRQWNGTLWTQGTKYRGRPKQPQEMVIPCYFTGNGLTWSLVALPEWVRVPELDKTIKVTK